MTLDGVSVRVPKDFVPGPVRQVLGVGGSTYQQARRKTAFHFITVSSSRVDSPRRLSLAKQARVTIESGSTPRKPTILPVDQLQGHRVYRLAGMVSDLTRLDEWGGYAGDYLIRIRFETDALLTTRQREQLIASVLKTFRWTD